MSDTKRLTQKQLSKILDLHWKWVRGEPGGVRANMEYADLEGANLEEANLEGANLEEANLTGANMWYAILTGANLTGANLTNAILTNAILTNAILTGANLTGANLTGANLWGASLEGANLTGANLWGASLEGANLWGASLEGANLRGANLRGAKLPPPSLDLSGCTVGYKKVWNKNRTKQVVIELWFPEGTKLVSTLIGRKCRASEAVVVRCLTPGYENETEFQSLYSERFIYRVGETVKPTEPFDGGITVECTSGIHFFTTKEEAEAYRF